jgi:hemoglobin-like flavoprotein
MTPEQIALVRNSYEKLRPARDELGRVFYARLFETNPELRRLFHGDIDRQAQALTAMLELIVKMLDLQDKLVPLVHYLGERHAAAGVRPEYFRPFGEALMWTLNHLLKDEFTLDTRRAWAEAYRFMTENMT